MKTAIILLYGLCTPEKKWYFPYLEFLASQISSYNFQKVILCGGFTDPQIPNDSEASTVKEYLLQKNPCFTNFILEDKSITTNQNLEFASKNISKGDQVTLYCDQDRKAKVVWIALHYLFGLDQKLIYTELLKYKTKNKFNDNYIYQNLEVVGFDFQYTDKSGALAQTYTSLLDVISLYDPDLDTLNLNQRKHDFNLI
jgi:hypothetical protein